MKKIGLALVGGGGRGAYHIGVWEALRENGLDQYVSTISGTSVGGLNAALFLQGNLECAKEIWENISVEQILTPRREFKPSLQNYTYKQLKKEYGGIYAYIRSGLVKIIEDNLDMGVFDQSSMNCYMCCKRTKYKKDMDDYEEMLTYPDGTKKCKRYVKGKATYFNLRSFSGEERKRILLATSAMPFIFPKEKIGGYYYMDGGMVDNLPVEPLYSIEKCEWIIVVHLTTNDRKIDNKRFPEAVISEIRPRKEQGGLFGGILDFKAESARRRIQEGYQDTIEMFRNIRESIDREMEPVRRVKEAVEREGRMEKILGQRWGELLWKSAEIQKRMED